MKKRKNNKLFEENNQKFESEKRPDNEFFEKNDQKIEPEKRPDFNLESDYYTGKKTPEEFPKNVEQSEEIGEGEEGEKSEPEVIKKTVVTPKKEE